MNDAWQPGDIIYVMNGTYRNTGYGTGDLNNSVVVNIGNTALGTLNGPLVLKTMKTTDQKFSLMELEVFRLISWNMLKFQVLKLKVLISK